MKAIIIRKNGGIENLIHTEVSNPEIRPDEVLVSVKAIGINPVDIAVRQYRQALQKIMNPPGDQESYILGWDISGTVVKTGDRTTEFEGKEVFGMVNFPGQGRAYAEYVAAPSAHLAVKPPDVSHEEAAAATLAALTAWQALIIHGKTGREDHVVIHGASGGVGHYAVQIAKYFGATVTGIASGKNRDFVLGLGADRFIDYTHENFEDIISDADVVIDSIESRDNLIKSMQVLKKKGRLISIKAYFDDETSAIANNKQLVHDRILVSSNGNDMKQIAQLLGKGAIKSHIHEIYSFNDMAKAHQAVEAGGIRGKVVVTL